MLLNNKELEIVMRLLYKELMLTDDYHLTPEGVEQADSQRKMLIKIINYIKPVAFSEQELVLLGLPVSEEALRKYAASADKYLSIRARIALKKRGFDGLCMVNSHPPPTSIPSNGVLRQDKARK